MIGLRSHSEAVTEPGAHLQLLAARTRLAWQGGASASGYQSHCSHPAKALPKRKCGQLWGRKPKVKYKPCTFRHPGMEGMGGRGGRADPAPLPCSPVPGLALEGCHWAAPALRAWTAGASVRCSGPCGEGIKLGPATLTRPPHRYLQRAFHVPAWCGALRSGRWQRITGISWDVPQVSGCSAEL